MEPTTPTVTNFLAESRETGCWVLHSDIDAARLLNWDASRPML
jgi:hypothetical protein